MSSSHNEGQDVLEKSLSSNEPSTRVVDIVTALRQPPPEPRAAIWTRRFTIASFWAVAILLGLPIWWKTTTIHRASLPLQAMNAWADGKA